MSLADVELEIRVTVDPELTEDIACQTVWEPDCPREVRWLGRFPCCGTERLVCDVHYRRWVKADVELIRRVRDIQQVFPTLQELKPACPYCGVSDHEPTWRPV